MADSAVKALEQFDETEVIQCHLADWYPDLFPLKEAFSTQQEIMKSQNEIHLHYWADAGRRF